MSSAPTQSQWLDETAKPLDLGEMDKLVRDSARAWAIYDEASKKKSDAHATAEAIDQKIIKALKDAGKKSYKVDGIGTMTIKQVPTVRVPGNIEAKKSFFDFLRADVSSEFMYEMMSVNSNSLNSWYNKRFEEAEAKGQLLGFSIPGVEPGSTRESLAFSKDRKA